MKKLFVIFYLILPILALTSSAQTIHQQDSIKTDKDLLVLEEALSDIGRWIWWIADKDMFHIEFAGTQLYIPPVEKGMPPTSILGLQFEGLKCVARISRDTLILKENVEWFDNLQKDLSKPFPLAPGSLTLSNPQQVDKYINEAQQITFFKGGLKDIHELNASQTFIGYLAGTAGMVIIAEKMKLTTHHGNINIKNVVGLNEKWWNYWKEYWKQKHSENPKPFDYNCEIIVPDRNDTLK